MSSLETLVYRTLRVLAFLLVPQVCAAPPDPEQPARTDRHGDALPAGALARLGTLRWRHDGSGISALAFSPDGGVLAVATRQAIHLRETATGKTIRRLEGTGFTRLAFTPDGKALAAVAKEAVCILDVATGQELRRCAGPAGVQGLALSRDGQLLASAGADSVVRLWEVATAREVRQIIGHDKPPRWLAFSPDGKTLASVGEGKAVHLWEVNTGKPMRQFQHAYDYLSGVAFTADGKGLVVCGITTVLLDVETGKKRWQFNYGGTYCLAMSPDGKVLATPGGNSIYLLDTASGRVLREIKDHHDPIYALAFAQDGQTLASGGYHTTVRLWHVATGREVQPRDAHQDGVCGVAFSPDGQTVVSSAGRDGTARLWQAASGKQLWKAPIWLGLDATFAPDGRTLALGSRLLSSAGQSLPKQSDHGCYTGSYSPDGKTLAVGSMSGQVELWDTAGRNKLREFTFPNEEVEIYCVRFSPDGDTVASAGSDKTVRLWDVSSGKVRLAWTGDYPIAWSPDGKIIAGGDGHGLVVLSDTTTGKAIRRFPGSGRHIAVVFSPDGKTLAVTGPEHAISLMELASGKERGRFAGHAGRVNALAFAPDGKTLASGSSDTTVLIWDMAPGPAQHLPEEAFWHALGSDDARQAYQAVWALAGRPESVDFLQKHLRPAQAGDPKRIAQLIADLDSNQFDVRERASVELEKWGPLAGPALERARAGNTTLELRGRIDRLLEKLPGLALRDEELRAWRALEVLERIGGSKARQVLERLAQGAPAARLTVEADATLRRLARRPALP